MAALCGGSWLLLELQEPWGINPGVTLLLCRDSLAAFPSVFSVTPHLWVALAKRMLFATAGCNVNFLTLQSDRLLKQLILLVVLFPCSIPGTAAY